DTAAVRQAERYLLPLFAERPQEAAPHHPVAIRLDLGIVPKAHQVQHGRREVRVKYRRVPDAPESRPLAVRQSAGRRVHPAGHVDLFVEDRTRVAELAVLAERLAVIGRVDDDGAVGEGRALEEAEQLADRSVLQVDGVLVIIAEALVPRLVLARL